LTALVILAPRGLGLPSFFVVFWVAAIALFILLFRLGVGERWGSKLALNVLWLIPIYWVFVLQTFHTKALVAGNEHAEVIVKTNGETIFRKAAMPTLANPLQWDYVFETDRATYRFPVVVGDQSPPRIIRYEKSSGPLAEVMKNVSTDRPVQIFLDFARFPVARLADPSCTTETLLQLADLRYTEPGNRRGTFTLEKQVDCPSNVEASR